MSNKAKLGDRVTVYAVEGRKVLDETGQSVTDQGTRITYNHYWLRLVRDKDISLTAPKPAAKKKGAE